MAKPTKMGDRHDRGRGGQPAHHLGGDGPGQFFLQPSPGRRAGGQRHPGQGGQDHHGDDQRERAQRRRLQVQVGTGLQVAVGQAVADPDHQADAERDGLPPARGQQHAEERDGREDVAEPVDADEDGQPQGEPAQRGQHLVLAGPVRRCPGAARDDQGVGQQAQAAEQQHLGQRLAERGAAGVLLGQAQRQDGRRGRRPSRADQPAGQAAEREHRAPADQRRGHQRGRDAAQPDRRGQDERHPGHELRHDPGAARVVVGAGEPQARVRAAERGQRVRDGQRAVVRDPVPHLEVRRGVAQVDDLFGALGDLPGRERDGHRHRARHRPPGHRALPDLPGLPAPPGLAAPPGLPDPRVSRRKPGQVAGSWRTAK